MKYVITFMKNIENVCILTLGLIFLSMAFNGVVSFLFSLAACFGVIWVWLSWVTQDDDSGTWD